MKIGLAVPGRNGCLGLAARPWQCYRSRVLRLTFLAPQVLGWGWVRPGAEIADLKMRESEAAIARGCGKRAGRGRVTDPGCHA